MPASKSVTTCLKYQTFHCVPKQTTPKKKTVHGHLASQTVPSAPKSNLRTFSRQNSKHNLFVLLNTSKECAECSFTAQQRTYRPPVKIYSDGFRKPIYTCTYS